MNAPEPDGNCRYDIIERSQIAAAAHLIARTFSRDEPLAVNVGQSHDEFTAMLKVLLPAALTAGLTMGAFNGHRMVGIALTTPYNFAPPPEIEGTSPNYRPIGALIGALERDYARENAARLDRCVHLHMLALDRAVRGRGIAQRLVEATAINARAQGYDAVVTDATNPASQRVFASQGFETIHEVRYDSFAHDGATRFASIANLGAIKLMEKQL